MTTLSHGAAQPFERPIRRSLDRAGVVGHGCGLQILEPREFLSVTYAVEHGELYARGTDAREGLTVIQVGQTVYGIDAGGVRAFKGVSGIVINLGGGIDGITVGAGVTIPVTLVTVDNARDTVSSLAPKGFIFADPADVIRVTRSPAIRIESFYGNVSKAWGVASPEPTDSGVTFTYKKPLFGLEIAATDVRQYGLADCWWLADLQAVAQEQPQTLRRKAFDLADGTYAVELRGQWVRVSGELSVWASARGEANQWAPLFEKAYAVLKGGRYAALNYGWNAFGFNDLGYTAATFSDGTAWARVTLAMAEKRPVTVATMPSVSALLPSHAYSVVSVSGGAMVLRNPWGFDGAGNDSNTGDGLVTITVDQFRRDVRAVFIA